MVVVGYGELGRRVASMGSAIGMKVIQFRINRGRAALSDSLEKYDWPLKPHTRSAGKSLIQTILKVVALRRSLEARQIRRDGPITVRS